MPAICAGCWPSPRLLPQVSGVLYVHSPPPSHGISVSLLVQPTLSTHCLLVLFPSDSVFCPQTTADTQSSEWVHSLQFLFAQGPVELGKVDWSSVLSSLISPRKPDGPCQKLATPGNLAELTGELLSNPGAPAWLQTRSGGGSAPCKEVPFCSEAGEDPRSRPGIPLGLFLLEELLLWCWGQGAWGLLIAYFRGWGLDGALSSG